MPDPKLTVMLAAVLVAMQGICWLLARGLRLRLSRAAMAGGLLAPFLLLAPWLPGGRVLAPCDILQKPVPGAPEVADPDPHDLLNDAIYQFLPWELEVRHAFSDRRLPFWSDLLEGGSSPWVNPQAAVLSPIAMAARIFPIQHFLLAALALKLLVAFEGTWLLARLTGRSRAASLLAAAGFALGGGVTSWALFPHTATVAWVPWLTAGTILLFRHPGPRRIATTAVLCAILLLSGHPETAAAGGLFAALCGLALWRRRIRFVRGFGAAAGAALLGFTLAAPHLLPFLSVLSASQRAHETLGQTMPDFYVSAVQPLTWFVPGYGKLVLPPTNPHAFGRPFQEPFRGPVNWTEAESGYTGLLAFAGAIIALLAVRDRRAWPFLGFAAMSLLLAAQFLPLAFVTHAIPILRVPAYARFLLVGSLALCVAGAFGVDRLLAQRPRYSRKTLAWAAFAAAAGMSLAVHTDLWVLGLWGGLTAAAVLASWRPRWAAAAFGLVLLFDLVPWSRSLLPAGHPELFYPRTPFMEELVREAADGGPWRVVGAKRLIYPSLLPVYDLAEPRPHNPLVPMDQVRVLRAAFGFDPSRDNYIADFQPDHPLLHFLNVRVVVATLYEPVGQPVGDVLERLDGGRFEPFRVFRNPRALPRWFLPTGAEGIERGRIEPWIAALQDPGKVALLREEAGDWLPAPRAVPEPVRALSAVPGKVLLEMPDPGKERLLATSIPTSRGWTAQADGRELKTLTVNGAFLGARIPEGVERMELRYVPPGLAMGCGLSLAAALLVLGLLWAGRRGSTVSTAAP